MLVELKLRPVVVVVVSTEQHARIGSVSMLLGPTSGSSSCFVAPYIDMTTTGDVSGPGSSGSGWPVPVSAAIPGCGHMSTYPNSPSLATARCKMIYEYLKSTLPLDNPVIVIVVGK